MTENKGLDAPWMVIPTIARARNSLSFPVAYLIVMLKKPI
jgi:hypothetical protein